MGVPRNKKNGNRVNMAQIHVLDSETIDRIAAGEVVERPSSVVKELVENAIDAGARAVTVEAKEGGIEFIRVTDNGCGMEGSQLRRAFLRHATSKIEDASDLERISSLGFRGEALSSIAAVAKVEVITKTSESITGNLIRLEGAAETAFEEVGAPKGTTFLVRNLFFNTPVRRRFLKQPATEGGYIGDLMEHLALSRPDISFRLTLNGQMKFHTSGSGDLKEVIYRIYGRDAANALVPVRAEELGIRIEGYLGKPVQVRSNRNFEIYFINGRFIRSNVAARAIEEGYKEYLMQHKFPFCVLHITMDTEKVDVNVHPSKMDVRFRDAPGFVRFLAETVRKTLQQREMIPEALLSAEKELKAAQRAERKEAAKQTVPEPFEEKRTLTGRLMEETRYGAERPKETFFRTLPRTGANSGDFFAEEPGTGISETEKTITEKFETEKSGTRNSETEESKTKTFGTEISGMQAEPETEYFFTEETETVQLSSEKAEGDSAGTGTALEHAENSQTASVAPDGSNAGAASTADGGSAAAAASAMSLPVTGIQLDLFEEKILTADNRSRFRIVGQVFDTYWLVEFEDKMMMIDQHAAHEKVNYERLMKRYREKAVISQCLMPPVIVSLSAQEESMMKEHLEAFAALGFEIEVFGGSEYALRSVPVDLYGCNEKEMFLEVLDSFVSGIGFGSIRVIEEKIASMSCKAAVKGNRRLSVPEAEALIDELLTLENPYNCPHGRPVIVSMTKAEMDRKFRRIVS